MFGLNEAHWNVVKRAARELNKAVSELPKEDRKNEKIIIAIIDKHHEPIKPLIERMRFVWTAGYLAGRVGKAGEYE